MVERRYDQKTLSTVTYVLFTLQYTHRTLEVHFRHVKLGESIDWTHRLNHNDLEERCNSFGFSNETHTLVCLGEKLSISHNFQSICNRAIEQIVG